MPLPVPRLTEREWARIARVLPPSGGVGRPRKDDRGAIAALLFKEALGRFYSVESIVGRREANKLTVKRRRWDEDGTWSRILKAGAPAIARMRTGWLYKTGATPLSQAARAFGW